MAHNLYMKDFDPEDPMHYSRLHGEIFSDSVFVVPTVVAANAHAGEYENAKMFPSLFFVINSF